MSDDKAYAVVKKYATMIEANVEIGLLTGNGIECFTSDTSFNDLFGAGDTIEVRVRIEDEQKALNILNAKFDKNDLK